MAINVKSLTAHKVDVRYKFTDGTSLIHDSKRYYIGSKAPENEVKITGRGDDVTYTFIDRGSEPDKYTWSVTLGSGRSARTTWYTGSSLPRVYDRFSNSTRSEWTEWNGKGSSKVTHTKSAEKTTDFIRKEKLGRRR